MPLKISRMLTTAVLFALGLGGCQTPENIDTRPTFAVRYATQKISPAVVQLNVNTEEFYDGQSHASQSIGSGFIIDKEGHVLTNFHVAGRAKRIDITLANLEHVRATLIGSDHWTDLALVQLDMEEIKRKKLTFEVASLGSSSSVELGEPVMAVGTPYGLSRTVTAGIVSQTDRWIDETAIDGYETGWFNNWIQTDAAINPGNSGGPLINLRGEVVGINTRGISSGNNLGFAIPIDTAKRLIPELMKNKKVTRSYVGITLQPLQDFENHYDVEGNQGVLISSVEKFSPALKAGLQPEDILLAVDGKPVMGRFPEQISAVRKLISEYPVGASVQLTVRRTIRSAATSTAPATAASSAPTSRGENKTFSVTTDVLESVLAEQKAIPAWGMTVRSLTRSYLRRMSLLKEGTKVEGVLVTSTRLGQPAERAKLENGDIIVSVDEKKVTSIEELQAAVAAWEKAKKNIAVDVIRNRPDSVITLSLKP